MTDVVLLSFEDTAPPHDYDAYRSGTRPGCDAPAPAPAAAVARSVLLECRTAVAREGAGVEIVTVGSNAQLDALLARFDGPARTDGLTWPAIDGPRLIVAASTDAALHTVLRRAVRRYAPPPRRRPADLPDTRTVPDLPPIAVLPLPDNAERQRSGAPRDLAGRLGLPRDPAEVATTVLHGQVRRLDLLRNDGGSVTVHGALLTGPGTWRARIEVDDVLLAEPGEPVLACAIAKADGYASLDGLPLAPGADPSDGRVEVAVAVPVASRSPWGRRRVHVEVRRLRGRAVSVTPRGEVAYLDDGMAGILGHKRSWWIEPGAWGVFRS